MIYSILLRNFQSHKRSLLEFHPGVNVIIGESDAGKSAIIRAFRWVKENRPVRDSFRSKWGGSTFVTINSNKNEITRIKNNTENGYILKVDDKIFTFSAIKTDVPQEVSDTLNLSDSNIHYQLDSPFLLLESAGEVAKHFNKVAKLDQIDLGLQNIQKWINSISKEIKFKEQSKIDLENELKQYENLDKLESELEVLESLENQILRINKEQDSLEKLISDYNELTNEIEEQSSIIVLENEIDSLLSLLASHKEFVEQKQTLKDFIQSFNDNNEQIEELNKLISCENLIDTLIESYKIITEQRLKRNNLKFIINEAKNISSEVSIMENEYNHLHKAFEKEMGDTCILCGSKLNKK